MKKYFILFSLILFGAMYAQSPGRAGERIENQIQQRQAKAPKIFSPQSRASLSRGEDSYRWRNTYDYSEVFLRIPERGYFAVSIDGQWVANGVGRYRFFEVKPGFSTLSIYQDDYLIFQTRLRIERGARMVFDFFTNQGLYLLSKERLYSDEYGFGEWDNIWNNPYNQGGGGVYRENPNFKQFMDKLNQNTFDSNKMQFLQSVVPMNVFTSSEIKQILRTFSFDKDRLKAAKLLFDYCIDKQNFYEVYDVFTFEYSKRELMDYLSKLR
ncbi:DUF4476 domain-containing protein [Ornithobacterium rhinotracheale]|uniref:DUF4476 domain-containing protein n=1 Tax=Ornithobacterium rhinotracheale TaxID=28251 RepID=UPI003FA481F3